MSSAHTNKRDALEFVQERNLRYSVGGVEPKPDPEIERARRKFINDSRDIQELRKAIKSLEIG